MGLDQPFLYRWVTRVEGAFTSDFGESCILRVSISQLLGSKFLISATICFALLIVDYLIAIPVGICVDQSRNPFVNNVLWFISYLRLALLNFLLALIIMLVFTVYFGDSMSGLFSREFRDAPWSWDKLWDFVSPAWLPVFILGWSAAAFAPQTVRALMLDEQSKLYVTADKARGLYGRQLLWRYPGRHALGPIANSLGFDLNRIFKELPIVAIILTLTEAGALLLEAHAQSNDQQLAGAIIVLLAATIVGLDFMTDVALAAMDSRMRNSVVRGRVADVSQQAKEAYFTTRQGHLIWTRFRKPHAAMVADSILVLLILMGPFADFIGPYNPTIAGANKDNTNGAPISH